MEKAVGRWWRWLGPAAWLLAGCGAQVPVGPGVGGDGGSGGVDGSIAMGDGAGHDPVAGGNDGTGMDAPLFDGGPGSETISPDGSGDGSGDGSDASDVKVCKGQAHCPCASNAECDSGLCFETADGGTCAATCAGDSGCQANEVCAPYSSSGGDIETVCVPRWVSLCAPCETTADCQSQVAVGNPECYDWGASGKFCSAPCSTQVPCPTGYICEGAPAHCIPAGGLKCLCSAWAAKNKKATHCVNQNTWGTCAALRQCTTTGPLPACTAAQALEETCNNADDDCDGVTDDGATTSCSDGNPCTLDKCDAGKCSHANAVECGDGTCMEACGETAENCPVDCHTCGDKKCAPGEGPLACPTDCCGGCGDGACVGYGCGEDPKVCAADCGTACGNGSCDKGENPANCKADCTKGVCGNNVCEVSDGGPVKCPKDCATTCGNCACEKGENFDSCPIDCGFCGDGTCSLCDTLGEGPATCPGDCGTVDPGCGADWQAFCDDGSACSDDACAPGKGCVHLPTAGTCSDDNACTNGDTCGGGVCKPGSSVQCDDLDVCTKDSCDKATGCVFTPFPAACSDGNACTVDDTCAGGSCIGGNAPNCGDNNVCTADSCDPVAGCLHAPLSGVGCSDDSACTLADACSEGTCVGGDPPDCGDGDSCTADICIAQSGCTHLIVAVAAPFFFDSDGDGYGTSASQISCTPVGLFSAVSTGDCDDSSVAISPGVTEICDGVDQNCNGQTDEAPAVLSCGVAAHAMALCYNKVCGVQCATGWMDVDGQFSDGCECALDANYGAGSQANLPIELGTISDNGEQLIVAGKLLPGETSDWYKVYAKDWPQPDNGCNTFRFHAELADVGDGAFRIDVYRGDNQPASMLCADVTESEWSVAFSGDEPFGPGKLDGTVAGNVCGTGYCPDLYPTPDPTLGGECNCYNHSVWTDAMPGAQFDYCKDNSSWFFVRVHRTSAAKTCDDAGYTLKVSNNYWDGIPGCTVFYADADGDGWGDQLHAKCMATAEAPFALTVGGDCDAGVASTHPTALEICDNVDQNCDGVTDEGCDSDGDHYCDSGMVKKPGISIFVCAKTPVPASVGDDCDDSCLSCHPGGKEVCDNRDNNCNGSLDDGMTLADTTCAKVGQCTSGVVFSCNGPAKQWNCDYAGVPSYQAPNETSCDGLDNNCDGYVDYEFTWVSGSYTYHVGNSCSTGICADTVVCNGAKNGAVCPGAGKATAELCANSKDDNCNGSVDETPCN